MNCKRKTNDNLDQINVQTLKVGKTKINSDASTNRSVTIPDVDGTLITSDDLTNIVTTNTPQTISALKTFTPSLKIGDSTVQSSATTGRTLSLPDASGSVLVNEATQPVTGTKTFSNRQTFISGVYPDSNSVCLQAPSGFKTYLYSEQNTLDTHFKLPVDPGVPDPGEFVTTMLFQTVRNKTMVDSKLGINGFNVKMMRFGSFTTSASIPSLGVESIGDIIFPSSNGFTVNPPSVFAMIASAAGNWDRTILTINRANLSTTNASILATNLSQGPTSGTATIMWFAIGN